MANKYRGEAELKRDGENPLTIRIGSRVICQAEAALGKTIGEICDDLGLGPKGVRLTTLVSLLRFSVVRPDMLSEEQACNLIDECGPSAVNVAIQSALAGAMGLHDTANPPEASTAVAPA